MFVVIEQVLDGSWDTTDLIGAYESLEKARKCMRARIAKVDKTYPAWRGYEWDKEYCYDGSMFCCRGYDGEGELFRWFIFNTDVPSFSYWRD